MARVDLYSQACVVRQGDGAIKFTDADGNVQVVRDIYMTKLFDALSALTLAE